MAGILTTNVSKGNSIGITDAVMAGVIMAEATVAEEIMAGATVAEGIMEGVETVAEASMTGTTAAITEINLINIITAQERSCAVF